MISLSRSRGDAARVGGARARHGRVDVSRVGGRAMRAPSRGGARGRPRGRRASDADHDRGVRGGGEDLRRGGVARVVVRASCDVRRAARARVESFPITCCTLC